MESSTTNSLNSSTLSRSIIVVLNPLDSSSDDQERAIRRHQVQQRQTDILQQRASFNESFVKEQFSVCSHLFTEDKITKRNVWNLRIIDILKQLCQSSTKDNLQVACTSIDISAKVYGLRVDSVHSEGIKLATNINQGSNKRFSEEMDSTSSIEMEEAPPNNREAGSKRPKKKRKLGRGGAKGTISHGSCIGPLPKLEPVDFTTRVNSETSVISNLLTNVLKEDHHGCSFLTLDHVTTLYGDRDPLIENLEDNYTLLSDLPTFPDEDLRINRQFDEFTLDEWDPELEEQQNAERSFLYNRNVMIDDQGIPIHELDGSLHDVCENNYNDAADIDEVQPFQADVTGEVVHITDFRSLSTSHSGDRRSEYSYNPIVSMHNGQFIDRIWAGPAHWKLKFIRNSVQTFSGQTNGTKGTKRNRQKYDTQPLTFEEKVVIDFSKKLVLNKKPLSVDINKITLPGPFQPLKLVQRMTELMLKPGVYPIENEVRELEQVDQYKFENLDDWHSLQGQDGLLGNAEDAINENEEVLPQPYLEGDLVDAPEMVPKSFVPYAQQAKPINMKKLKDAIWQSLTKPNISIPRENLGIYPTTFSRMYQEIPELLSGKERRELTCPLAFIALLDLCNEHNLTLTQLPGVNDFEIKCCIQE